MPNSDLERVDALYASVLAAYLHGKMQAGAVITLVVGNEPFAPWNNVPSATLLSAYTTLRAALVNVGIKASVKMTVPFQFGVVADSYPPTAATFADPAGRGHRAAIASLASLMHSDGDSFEINVYTYFAHKANARDISLAYALGSTGHTVGGRTYSGLLDAMHSGVEAALLKLDARFTRQALPVSIGETGWPTQDNTFGAASAANAATFARNAVSFANAKGVDMYPFEAFDEQRKSQSGGAGPLTLCTPASSRVHGRVASHFVHAGLFPCARPRGLSLCAQTSDVEDHWGAFFEDGSMKYEVHLCAVINFLLAVARTLGWLQALHGSPSSPTTTVKFSGGYARAAWSMVLCCASSSTILGRQRARYFRPHRGDT